ncbi:MAG: Uma2 family endonuclease [Bacteroidota bacterium]
MSSAIEKVPTNLIYEMVNGKPIYYKGYQDYLSGRKKIVEVMGSSKIQAYLVAELIFLLKSYLSKEYIVFTNELGIQFSHKNWRAADIAVIHTDAINSLDDKYLNVPPDLVIEIDTKAELSELNNPIGYYHEKTEDLLSFGVGKVIWIFTDTEKVMIATSNEKWSINDWQDAIDLMEGLTVNLSELTNRKKN